MTLSIRPVEQGDAESWERLRNLLWEGDDHKSEITKFFNGEAEEPNEVFLAVTEGNDVIAHIELSLRYDIDDLIGIKTGYIEGLFVEEQHRTSGVELPSSGQRIKDVWHLHQTGMIVSSSMHATWERHLTIHSSRTRFAVRLNSGVLRH